MTAQQKISRKIAAQTTASLKEMAASLASDTRDGAGLVLSAVLDSLMVRMPDAEFVSFCDAL